MSVNQRLAQPIEASLAEAEALRQRLLKRCQTALVGYAFLLACCFLLAKPLLLPLLWLGWAVPVMVYVTASASYRRAYKAIVIPRLLHELEPGLRYSPHAGISQAAFEDSMFSPGGVSGFSSEDLIEGHYAGRHRRISEICATRDSGKNKSTIFKGLFSETTIAQPLRGHVVVVPDVAERLLGSIGTMLQGLNTSRGSLVRFDDPVFEKAFAVYAEHERDARRLLTKRLRQELLNLRERAGHDIGFTVCEDKVYVLVSCAHDHFTPSLFESAIAQAPLDRFQRDLTTILATFEAIPLAELT